MRFSTRPFFASRNSDYVLFHLSTAAFSAALNFLDSPLPKSPSSNAPIATPAPIADVLPLIFKDVYPKFEGGRFDVTIDSTLEDEGRVLVEYTARGKLTTGVLFECGYAAVFEFVDGSIVRVRMYTDTRYVAAALM